MFYYAMYSSGHTLHCAVLGGPVCEPIRLLMVLFGRSLRVALCFWAPAGQYICKLIWLPVVPSSVTLGRPVCELILLLFLPVPRESQHAARRASMRPDTALQLVTGQAKPAAISDNCTHEARVPPSIVE